jgi:hypothetical protein
MDEDLDSTTRNQSGDATSGSGGGNAQPDAASGSDQAGNLQKDPDDWATGEEPMTAAQASYLKTLSAEAGEEMDEHLTKAEASKRIDELQGRTGRGQ